MAKYRQAKVKRQHHVLKELEEGLAFLASLEAVDAIIPGVIRPKWGGKIGFSYQYRTASGLKLIGRSSGAAQEIFVVSRAPDEVLRQMEAAHWLPARSER
ncbi:MAG: DUF2103 domain-containing protein [Firmicutes bacterium]|nr:hypothetical protein [Alicyclobacillaceae bacterium]MCL6497668.1 DUF2103 domain-containing protein [Bacillota bacterium]